MTEAQVVTPKPKAPTKKATPKATTPGFYGTGRRKEAAAKVWILPGQSGFQVNGAKIDEYFPAETLVATVIQPLVILNKKDAVGVKASVSGGGMSGQAGAIRHGLARALLSWNVEHKRPLREGGFLTRDPRMKERKKFGHKRARKSFQYSKR